VWGFSVGNEEAMRSSTARRVAVAVGEGISFRTQHPIAGM